MTDDGNINAVVVYHRAVTEADLDVLRALGIRGGTRFRALPMVAVSGTPDQIIAVSKLASVRYLSKNRTLQWNAADESRSQTGLTRVWSDAELRGANNNLPLERQRRRGRRHRHRHRRDARRPRGPRRPKRQARRPARREPPELRLPRQRRDASEHRSGGRPRHFRLGHHRGQRRGFGGQVRGLRAGRAARRPQRGRRVALPRARGLRLPALARGPRRPRRQLQLLRQHALQRERPGQRRHPHAHGARRQRRLLGGQQRFGDAHLEPLRGGAVGHLRRRDRPEWPPRGLLLARPLRRAQLPPDARRGRRRTWSACAPRGRT